MSTPRIVENNAHEALARMIGTEADRALLAQAIDEREALLRDLHRFRQDHRVTIAKMIQESADKIERCMQYLKQATKEADHG